MNGWYRKLLHAFISILHHTRRRENIANHVINSIVSLHSEYESSQIQSRPMGEIRIMCKWKLVSSCTCIVEWLRSNTQSREWNCSTWERAFEENQGIPMCWFVHGHPYVTMWTFHVRRAPPPSPCMIPQSIYTASCYPGATSIIVRILVIANIACQSLLTVSQNT